MLLYVKHAPGFMLGRLLVNVEIIDNTENK